VPSRVRRDRGRGLQPRRVERRARRASSELAKNIQRRSDAAQAFPQANVSRAVRAAVLARSRPLGRCYTLGERVYYRRIDRSDTNLEK